MIYVVTFILASAFFVLSVHNRERVTIRLAGGNYKSRDSIICAMIGILLLSILAGLRSPEIGVDVKTYVLFSWKKNSQCTSIKEVLETSYLEIGYEIIEYLISRVTSDVHWMHFVTSLIIVGGMYKFARSFGEKNSVVMSMLIFICMYYNQSLNMIRQWMAMAIYLGWGTKYLLNEKYFKYICVCIIAMFFHSSAIIGILILGIYTFVQRKNKHLLRFYLLVAIAAIAMLSFDKICLALISIGLLPAKYMLYFTEEIGVSSVWMQILARVPLLIGAFILRKPMRSYDDKCDTWNCFMILDLFIGMLGSKYGLASRLSYYFGVWQCMYMSEIYVVLKSRFKKRDRVWVTIFVVSMLVLYWYYYYVIRRFDNTYPYASDIITWL